MKALSILSFALLFCFAVGCGSSNQSDDSNFDRNRPAVPGDSGEFKFTSTNPIDKELKTLAFSALYESDETSTLAAFNKMLTNEEDLLDDIDGYDITHTPVCQEINSTWGVIINASEAVNQLCDWYNETIRDTAAIVIRIRKSNSELEGKSFEICKNSKDSNYNKGNCALVDFRKTKCTDLVADRIIYTESTICKPTSGTKNKISFSKSNDDSGYRGSIDMSCDIFEVKQTTSKSEKKLGTKKLKASFRSPQGGAIMCRATD